ncbi:hypothetical protein GCM10011514_40970 [Emticicia aquatilis]|uniref:Uncharacterized protein n=1 Tax=Emticicia aquatilis TaxID=1537369 RepID=A0A917DW01_9BACT|nr:hypothetical protein [Emticicia aquatilis]GGD72665.1 hypothetical protein GCM10011514_40970 [Emticicia aquatilis]
MKRKISITLATFILIILPFLVGIPISKYSPYVETNSFKTYVIIWIIISIALVLIVLVLSKYYSKSFGALLIGGLWLFLLISPIAGIIGLASAPDLSLKMLQHPEREHLRYIFLFIAALLFAAFSLFLLKSNSLKISTLNSQIVRLIFIIAFAEFIWEFSHHYLYPEALKEWINQGNKVVEFSKKYDNIAIINIGVLGRLVQFSLAVLLSIRLYKLGQIKIWCPIIITLFSLIGIISASVIFLTQMNIPKGFEILFLFFIPGIPFLLFYWLGVALLTKFKKSEITT